MGIQDIEVFVRSTTTGEVTEKRRILRNVVSGERLEIWVNDVLVYEHEWENPWGEATDKEWKTKW